MLRRFKGGNEEDFAALNRQVAEQYDAIEVLPGVFINGQITIGENVADLGGIQVAFDALESHLAANSRTLDAVLNGPISDATSVPETVASPVAKFATPADVPAVATPIASPPAVQEVRDLTQRERFFIAAATVWRTKVRDEALVTQVQTDEHSPALVRATQPLRNMDAFHRTFDIEAGDAMFLEPEERVVIW